jgi:hypothetical protein
MGHPDAIALGRSYVSIIPSSELQVQASNAPMEGMAKFVEAYYKRFGKNKKTKNFKVSQSILCSRAI